MKLVKLPVTLYAFGNKSQPRSPRENIDILVENNSVKLSQPPTGASTFADISFAPISGHYHKLEQGTELPEGFDFIADGKDVGGNHLLTHYTIYPSREMPFSEFAAKFQSCSWAYAGKKEVLNKR
jgi:hypothetical protein